MKILALTLSGVLLILSLGYNFISVTPTAAQQLGPEHKVVPLVPTGPKLDEANIDSRISGAGYREDKTQSVHPGRADPRNPATFTISLFRPGRWAIAVYPVLGNCDLSVSYNLNRNGGVLEADMGLGFPVILLDLTQALPYADVNITVLDKTPDLACPFRAKVYSRS